MVKKWEIYYLDFNPIKGSEQRGIRPALVISNDSVNQFLPVFTVLPLSSIKPGSKIYPTEVELMMNITGLPKDSVAMIQQIRTVSQDRIVNTNKSGEISDMHVRGKINQALIDYFELDE
jgi:mRNA interferase MazF